MATDLYGEGGTGERNDCVVRALSVAACVPYDEAHAIYKGLGRKDRRKLRGGAALTPRAIKIATGKEPNRISRPGTIGRFVKENGRQGHWVISVAGHQLAIVDGIIYDWSYFAGKTKRVIRNAYRVDA